MMILWQTKTILVCLIICLVLFTLLNLFKGRKAIKAHDFRNVMQHLFRRKAVIVICTLLFLAVYCGSRLAVHAKLPKITVKFNYEEASRGKNPNGTRFNESELLSDEILEEVIERGGFPVTVEELGQSLSLVSSFDEQEIDTETLKIATDYNVVCEPDIFKYNVDGRALLVTYAEVYRETFLNRYSENDAILSLDFNETEDMDYLDIDTYMELKAQKLEHYIRNYSYENSNYRLSENGETFASLADKTVNFIDVELERFHSFVLENGLSKQNVSFATQMDYENRILQTDYEKSMAAYHVRLETITMYDDQMARIVLVPTTDEELEFYMSRTKIGADYFADEADTALAEATATQEEMHHNSYARDQVLGAGTSASTYAKADSMIEDLKSELTSLAQQAKNLSASYINEKRNGYLQIGFVEASLLKQLDIRSSCIYTLLFMMALCGFIISGDVRKAAKNHARPQ